MRARQIKKTVIISAVILLTGAAVVFAGGYGRGGWGGHMMGYGGYGNGGHMMGYGMGPGMMYNGYGMGPGMMYDNDGYRPGRGQNFADLSEEDRAKIDAAQDKFFESTAKLREQIEEKRFALAGELRKENPETAKVVSLQKDLSKLEGEFEVKAVEHRLEMQKLLPDTVRRGYGRGYGPGYCWR